MWSIRLLTTRDEFGELCAFKSEILGIHEEPTFFMLPFIKEGVEEYQLYLLVYDAEEKVIVIWQK